jgi:hypothetical protein
VLIYEIPNLARKIELLIIDFRGDRVEERHLKICFSETAGVQKCF